MEIRGVIENSTQNVFAINEAKEKPYFPTSKNEVAPLDFKLDKTEKNLNQSQKNKEDTDKFSFGKKLSPEEQKRVEELKRIDSKVRAHEMAHIAAGGGLVRGGANYQYEIGPDGKQYATGGEVKIDMSVNPDDPEGAIQKMQQVRRAALAPADPSPQDRSVAQQASNIEAQMRAKLLEEKTKAKTPNKFLKVYKNIDSSESISKQFQIDSFVNSSPTAELKKRVNIKI